MGECREADRRGNTFASSPRQILLVATAALALAMSFLLGVSPTSAGAESLPDGPGTITVDQSPVGATGFCLPPFLALTHSVAETPTTFTLKIFASPSLCQPVSATAAIYAMPLDGSLWPQTLALKQDFIIPGPGVTTVTFHKGCLPAQFDVLTGATPPVISPTGPWHGPLLFPFALETSLQNPGGDCVGGNCETYTPKNVTVSPDSVAPGGTVTVAGSGVPGTTIEILLQQPPAAAVPTGASVVVPANGSWSVPVTVPASTSPGTWQVVARVEGCDTQTSADLTVTGPGEEPATPPAENAPTNPPPDGQALASTASNAPAPLPAAAVAGATETQGTSSAADAQAAGLAFTGSTIRLPVLIGVGLLVAGVLLLLKRRRQG